MGEDAQWARGEKMIAIGNDHVGIELKEAVIEVLDEYKLPYKDFGTYSSERVDYPVFAQQVAHAVTRGECEFGILLCGTGVGISIAANKVKGIRCVVCSDPYSARLSREHNDTNILAMGARVVGIELAKMILRNFLDGKFEDGRHGVRVEMIGEIEYGTTLY